MPPAAGRNVRSSARTRIEPIDGRAPALRFLRRLQRQPVSPTFRFPLFEAEAVVSSALIGAPRSGDLENVTRTKAACQGIHRGFPPAPQRPPCGATGNCARVGRRSKPAYQREPMAASVGRWRRAAARPQASRSRLPRRLSIKGQRGSLLNAQ